MIKDEFVNLQDERFDKDHGPSIEELVAKEMVDKLTYMGWTEDQGADPEKVNYNLPVTCTLPMHTSMASMMSYIR